MKKITVILTIILSLIFTNYTFSSQNKPFKIREVKPYFHHSPIADYVFFLFYRTGLGFDQFPELKEIDLSGIPFSGSPGMLPELTIIHNVKKYSEIYPLIEKEKIKNIVASGEKNFPQFLKIWEEKIEPYELKIIEKWKKEYEETKPMEKLQKLTKLEFPSDEIHICATALNFTGTNAVSYPYVFSLIFNLERLTPNVAWFIGHEATHLLMRGCEKDENLQRKLNYIQMKTGFMAEESLCLVMQNRLAVECGFLKENQMQEIPEIKYYTCLQSKWDEYINNPDKYPTIIDLMLECRKEPYIGITIAPITEAIAKKLGISYDPKTIIVYKVIENSPAEKVGIKKYDIIFKIDDIKIESRQTFDSEIAKHQIGDKIKLTTLRENKEIEFEITLDGKI